MEPKNLVLGALAAGILSAIGVASYEAGKERGTRDLFPNYRETPVQPVRPNRERSADAGATGHLIQLGDRLCDLGMLQAGQPPDEACEAP